MPICTKSLDYIQDTQQPTTTTSIVEERHHAEPCHDITNMIPLTNHDDNPEEDNIEDEEGDEEEEEELAICGDCGKVLGPGWQCSSCRRSCPHCNRALTTDPDDYCGRCFRKCDKHGIVYSLISGEGCPKCSKSDMTSRPSR